MANRRSFLLGIGAALAAPAVVRAESLMKIAVLRESVADKTITALVNEHIMDTWYRQQWKTVYLGFDILRTSIASDGTVTVEPLEDFHA